MGRTYDAEYAIRSWLNHFNRYHDKNMWMTVSDLSRRCEVPRKVIEEELDKLIQRGFIEKEQPKIGGERVRYTSS